MLCKMTPGKKQNLHNFFNYNHLTLASIRKFIVTLMNFTLCNDVEELKNHMILECIWKKMGKELATNHKILKYLWTRQLHMQLFSPEPIYSIDTKIKLIEYLYEKGITNPKVIQWDHVILYFNGFTKQYLQDVHTNLLKVSRRRTNIYEYEENIKYLYNEYIPYLVDNLDDKKLPRIKFSGGNIVYLENDSEKMEYYIQNKSIINESNRNFTLSFIQEIIKTLMELTLSNDIKELKNHIILECIWRKMEKRLNIDKESLKSCWYNKLHMQLFCQDQIHLYDIEIKLIEYLQETNVRSVESLNWNKAIPYFDGFSRQFLSKLLSDLIELAKVKTNSSKWEDHLHYLYNKHIEYLVAKQDNKILPRLIYNKGTIIYLRSDLEKLEHCVQAESTIDGGNENWTFSFIQDFIKILMKFTLSNTIWELKNHAISECIWRKMEIILGTDEKILKSCWYNKLHLQLFCQDQIHLNDTEIKFIEYLHENIKVIESPNWNKIISYFDGFSRQFLSRLLSNLIELAKLKTHSIKWEDHVSYLYNEHIKYLAMKQEDKILPRLIYNEGNIKHLDIDVKETKS